MWTATGAWVICSAPLTLGYDLIDDNITEHVWDIIANKEAIAVNQAWAGHPGKLFKSLPSGQKDNAQKNGCGGYSCDTQVWMKPLSQKTGAVAVVLLSNSDPWKDGTKVANTSYMIKFSWFGESSLSPQANSGQQI